jgi:hypothetical protein
LTYKKKLQFLVLCSCFTIFKMAAGADEKAALVYTSSQRRNNFTQKCWLYTPSPHPHVR